MEPSREQDETHRGTPTILRVPTSLAGLRADAFVCRELPAVSRTRIRQKIQMGESLLNGHRYSTSTHLRAGDEITISWRRLPEHGAAAQFPVLFEDGQLLAVDKPAGVASHPMGKRQSGTVVQFARMRYAAMIRESLGRGDPGFYPSLVNRLDVFTSGIVILALTGPVHKAMQAMVVRRLLSREYAALVEGRVEDEEGLVDFPIGPDTASQVRLKKACRPDGRASVTLYTVFERLPGHTLLRVMPLTGRQHQIRVHLAAIGHPVFGDLLYKDERLFLAALQPGAAPPARHWLHARRASFAHPVTGAPIVIESPIPADLRLIAEKLREGGREAPPVRE
jgi:23S rRNA pseudouridine1911/1915/1917 synthase